MLIRWNEKVRWVQDFLLLPQGFKRFPSDLPRARWRNLVCAECLLMIKPMMVSFCFIEGWCWVIGVGFENTCTISRKWNVSRGFTITFTFNNDADNHFYKCIYLFQMLYRIKSVFFIKIHVQVLYIQIWFKCETSLLFLLIKIMVCRKKLFLEKYSM